MVVASSPPEIVDIRAKQDETAAELCQAIARAFTSRGASVAGTFVRQIPTLVLYDTRGLDLFDQITYLDEYYLTGAEIDVLSTASDQLVAHVRDGDALIELGVGAMRKTTHLLDALVAADRRKVTYYAVDVDAKSLAASLGQLAHQYPSIRFVGLYGTYDDALGYVQAHVDVPKTFLWLGSSIGNFTRPEAATFLAKVQSTAMDVGDRFVCGIDRRNAPELVKAAYNDTQGITREFELNGLDHANALFGSEVFPRTNFAYASHYNEGEGRHEACYQSLQAQTIKILGHEVDLEPNELINVEYSHKYSQAEVNALVRTAGLDASAKYTDAQGRYDVHVFTKTL